MITARIVSHAGRQQPHTLWVNGYVNSFHESYKDADATLVRLLRRQLAVRRQVDASTAMAEAFAKTGKRGANR